MKAVVWEFKAAQGYKHPGVKEHIVLSFTATRPCGKSHDLLQSECVCVCVCVCVSGREERDCMFLCTCAMQSQQTVCEMVKVNTYSAI